MTWISKVFHCKKSDGIFVIPLQLNDMDGKIAAIVTIWSWINDKGYFLEPLKS